MNKYVERLYNGIFKENPTLILMLGMCPTLAVTTSSINGLGMGLTTTIVLMASNFIISLLRKIIPNRMRIPSYIVIVASMVTIVQLLLQAYLPSLYNTLGIYIPLIVVNCIILGRAEAYASKHNCILSLFDGIGMGLGFTLALTCIGLVREILGSGTFFGIEFAPLFKDLVGFNIYSFFSQLEPATIFVMAPGAFFVLAGLTAIQNRLKLPSATNTSKNSGCDHDCLHCHNHVSEKSCELKEEK